MYSSVAVCIIRQSQTRIYMQTNVINNCSVPENNVLKCSGICRAVPWNNDNLRGMPPGKFLNVDVLK